MKKHSYFFFCFFLVALNSFSNTETPPISPTWVLGHIVWEDSLNTQSGVLKLVDDYLKRNIPVNGVIIDSPWSTSYNDFNWDTSRYPTPQNMAAEFAKRKIKPILWMTGAVNIECQDVPISPCDSYNYVIDNNYGANNNQIFTWWKGKGVHIDFTNEDAKEWWYSQLDKVFDGFYGFKVDGAEVGLGEPVNTSKGEMSNQQFRYFYYDAMYDYVTSRKPDTGIIYARPYSYQGPGNYANPYKLSIGWCGDFEGTYEGLRRQITDIYQSAKNGYCAVGCEIGGYYGETPSAEVLIRYAQFASMTACMINGGANGAFRGHLPWWHGDYYYEIYQKFVYLHKELIPYIFSSIVDNHIYGGTLIRTHDFDSFSHFLGESIFTKAIVSEDNVSFLLPDDRGYLDLFTEKYYEGGTMIDSVFNIDRYPIYVKMGSIIPLDIENSISGNGDESMIGKKVIAIYPYKLTERIIHWPTGDGIDYEDIYVRYDEKDGFFSVTSGTNHEFVLLIHNIDKVSNVIGANDWNYDNKRRILKICAEGQKLGFHIEKETTTSVGDIKMKDINNSFIYSVDGKKALGNSRGLKIVRKEGVGIKKILK